METLWNDIRTKRFLRHAATQFFMAGGFIVALIEAADLILDVRPPDHLVTAISIIGICLAFTTFRVWPRPLQENYQSPNISIKILEGDLFEQNCHIVVGTCDTFDTSTPNIISLKSLQARAADRLYGGDLAVLDLDLSAALSTKPIVGTIAKKGKTDKYGIGSIAALRNNSHLAYFLAYCEMNEDNNAHSSPDWIWKSLEMLWTEVRKSSNGEPIALPVIGGGQSKVSQILPAQDSIRLTILSYVFASRAQKVCSELRIIVPKAEYERLDRLELQAFLSSLRAS